MSVHKLKLQNCEEGLRAAALGRRSARELRRVGDVSRWLPGVLIAAASLLWQVAPARAQAAPTPTPVNPCPPLLSPGQIFVPVPEIISAGGVLRGTMVLGDEQTWIPFRVPTAAEPSDANTSQCVPQHVRTFREYGAVSTTAAAPPGNNYPGTYAVPRPGPTLRAKLGDIIELTFLNLINASNFPGTIDRGETGEGGGCDETSAGYPGRDTYPDCFHGSSTGNIHFHGTHTNPNTTGDNVFIEVRPALRENSGKLPSQPDVQKWFDQFFTQCEAKLRGNVLYQWPMTWADLPKDWTEYQQQQLTKYDSQLKKNYPNAKQLWPVDKAQRDEGAWPQYYIGSYPYCFTLPAYPTASPMPTPTPTQPTGSAAQPIHGGAGTVEHTNMDMATAEHAEKPAALHMGQSPGTHWYHAHKHGSTAINVANGMTGVFIIEGDYDTALSQWYDPASVAPGATLWTRKQPVMVINQLGVTPNLGRAGSGRIDKGPDFSVNGQAQPVLQMQPGEVKMWRIANTSGRAGVFFTGPPQGFEWKQIAQDGVQFNGTNYADKNNHNQPFLLASGNRADLLIKAPATPCTTPGGCNYRVLVKNEVDPSDRPGANPVTLVTINVSGAVVTGNASQFIPPSAYPVQPPFLADIKDEEVKGTKTIVFGSAPPPPTPTPSASPSPTPFNAPYTMHMIDGKKFDGEVGEVVLLNTVEEWKVVNQTVRPAISHPFHIHINPFQITEVFDPNEPLTDKSGNVVYEKDKNGKVVIDKKTKLPVPVNRYVFQGGVRLLPGQCYLNPFGSPEDWKPCTPPARKNMIWWDVFPIPSGRTVTSVTPAGKITVNVPGYFKMRSRFVDYTGYYVIHCHILAHEDRGMMTIVEVAPARTPYSHH
jgi:FtsP/CotA-like multicopper oxidase with cupredoxin domain